MRASRLSEHELVDRVARQRGELVEAADSLRRPAERINRADRLIRRSLPVLPYVLAGIAALGIAAALLRGRGLRPSLLLATALDLWRLWKAYKASSQGNTSRAIARHPPP